MTETHEHQDNTGIAIRPAATERPNRLYRALAWVGIAAGSLFIVATVFFSGYVLGKSSDAGKHHGPNRVMMTPLHRPMGPGGPMGPGMGPDGEPRSARLAPPSAPATPPTP